MRLGSTLSLDALTEYILDTVIEIIGKSEIAILFLVDTEKQELNLISTRLNDNFDRIKAKRGDILDEWVFKQRQRLLIEDIKKDFRFSEDKLVEYPRPFRSVISCPIIEENKVLGVIRLEHSSPYNYNSEDLRLLDILCDLAAVSLANARFYKETLNLAITDGLTGLYLRRHFLDRLNEEFMRSLRNNLDISVIILDIDDFKNYNDQYGHTAGDIVLKVISNSLKATIGERGIISRFGGEEFSIFLPEADNKEAKQIAEQIRKGIKALDIQFRRVKTNVTVSIGLASFPLDGKFVDELIQKADERLYIAKRQGKDRVVS